MNMNALPLAWSVPNWTDRLPLVRSARVKPAKVRLAMGTPGAVAWSVRPVNPAAPCPSTKARLKSCGVTPQTVALSPEWNPTTVLQMSAGAARSSTKNVSNPDPPTRKLDS